MASSAKKSQSDSAGEDGMDPELVKLLGPSLKAASKTARASLNLTRDIATAMYAAVEAQQRAHAEAQAQTVQLCRDLAGDDRDPKPKKRKSTKSE